MPKTTAHLILVLLLLVGSVRAQDSLPAHMPLMTAGLDYTIANQPAYTGAEGTLALQGGFEQQWPGGVLPATQYGVSAHYGQVKNRWGFGVGLQTNRRSDVFTNSGEVGLTAALRFKNEKALSISVGGGAVYRSINTDGAALSFGDMIDPRRGFVYQTAEGTTPSRISYLTVNAGIFVTWKNAWLGISGLDLNQPNRSVALEIDPKPATFLSTAGYRVVIGGNSLIPSVQTEWDYTGIHLSPTVDVLVDDMWLVGASVYRFNEFRIRMGVNGRSPVRALAYLGLPANPAWSRLGNFSVVGVQLQYNLPAR